jgi:serine protease Do
VLYIRDNKELKATVTLEKNINQLPRVINMNRDFNFNMPDLPALRDMKIQYSRKPKLGLEIQDLEEGKGVKVLDVEDDMPAAKAGLQKDDQITEVDGVAVTSVDELKAKISQIKEGDHLKLGIQRKGKKQEIEVKIPKKLKTADL